MTEALTKMPGERKILLLEGQDGLPPLTVKLLKKVPEGITVTIDPKFKRNEAKKALNGMYFFEGDRIHVTTRDPSVLAHELGHAMSDEDLVGRLSQSKFLYPLHALAPLGAVAATGISETVSHPVARAILLGAPFLLTVPSLVAEARASMHGHEILKRIGATEEELAAFRRKMARYYLSYLVNPALTGVLTATGRTTRRTS